VFPYVQVLLRCVVITAPSARRALALIPSLAAVCLCQLRPAGRLGPHWGPQVERL